VATVKRIVCLAKSRMWKGNCIAGREFEVGKLGAWIRPVSKRKHQEISDQECKYTDHGSPNLLDIIDVPLLGRLPKGHQQENWLVDSKGTWAKTGRMSWDELIHFADNGDSLWVNGYKTAKGINDQVPVEHMLGIGNSLTLIYVEGLSIRILTEGADYGEPRQRVQGAFRFSNAQYRIKITDHSIEDRYSGQTDGVFRVGECLLTVSLAADPFFGNHYKLIAGVMEKTA